MTQKMHNFWPEVIFISYTYYNFTLLEVFIAFNYFLVKLLIKVEPKTNIRTQFQWNGKKLGDNKNMQKEWAHNLCLSDN
jgi:hypothetical protein